MAQMLSARLGREIEIVHDELTNNVLAKQAIERAGSLIDKGLITKNEGRDIGGYEPRAGGDNIMEMPGLVPQYTDLFTGYGDGTEIEDPAAGEDDAAGAGNGKRPARPGSEAPARTALN
jgi:hypothetical protein